MARRFASKKKKRPNFCKQPVGLKKTVTATNENLKKEKKKSRIWPL